MGNGNNQLVAIPNVQNAMPMIIDYGEGMRNDRNLNESVSRTVLANNNNSAFYGDIKNQNKFSMNGQLRMMPIVSSPQNGIYQQRNINPMIMPTVTISPAPHVQSWHNHHIQQQHQQIHHIVQEQHIQHIQRPPLEQASVSPKKETSIDYTKTHLNSSAFDD